MISFFEMNKKAQEASFEGLIDRLGWIAFAVIILAAMYFLTKKFIF